MSGLVSAFFSRAGRSCSGRNRSKSSRIASGTGMVMTCLESPDQSFVKLVSSAATRWSSPSQERKMFRLSQFRVHPASVSFRLPLKARRSPVLSSMMPAFSWKMPWAGMGRRCSSHGTATCTSRIWLATIHASNSSAATSRWLPGLSGFASRWAFTWSRHSAPLAMASTSGGCSVHPTSSRIRPLLRTNPSMPRAASARAFA